MGKRDASHFITEYYTERGKVELMIPTDATDDDFALLKDILALVEAKMKQRADRKTEPQTEMEKSGSRAVQTARCLNCHNAKACKEKHWEVCRYEPWKLTAVEDEPQTERSSE